MSKTVLVSKLTQRDAAEFKKLLNNITSYNKQFRDRKGTITTLRSLKITDMSQFIKLVCDIEAEEPNSEHLPFSKAKDIIKKALKNTNPIMLVAKQHDNVVAYIWGYDLTKDMFKELNNYLLGTYVHVSYISDVAVTVFARRRGIAEGLLDAYADIAKKKGVNDLILDTLNPIAERLYEKLHYKPAYDSVLKKDLVYKNEGKKTYRAFHLEIN